MSSFLYRMQLPNINTPVYTPRKIRPDKVTQGAITLDLSALERQARYVPGSFEAPISVSAMWTSLVLNDAAKPSYIRGRWDNESVLLSQLSTCSNLHSFHTLTKCVQGFLSDRRLGLSKIIKWTDIRVALAEGLTVMVGGAIYESFMDAYKGTIVPMPKPGEGLLGGHVFNLVGIDDEKDMIMAVSNLGSNFGDRGLVYLRGSYVRNLGICRDFFVLKVEQ